MEPLANIEGRIVPLQDVRVSVLDRGFLFGDAVYEVLRVYQGRPWLEEEHFQRLQRSLTEIRIQGVNLDRLRHRMHQTIAAGPFHEATVYIQITRGAAPRAHPFPVGATPFELLYVQPFTVPYADARKVGGAVVTHPDLRWDRCDIKSTNLLGNVLAMQAATEAGCLEALLYLPDGTITEGTHTSLFAVLDGRLLTSPNSHAILPGCTRGLVLRLARECDIPVLELQFKKSDLGRITELFLTGTTSEVLPIIRVDGQSIGNGKPGPITIRLQHAYAKAVQAFLHS